MMGDDYFSAWMIKVLMDLCLVLMKQSNSVDEITNKVETDGLVYRLYSEKSRHSYFYKT